MMKKIIIYGVFFAVVGLFVVSCQYKYTIEPIIPPPDPTDTIFFSTQIVPIWTDGEFCTQCHKTGATAPDLTAANAYSSINAMGLVNVDDPASSMIYDYVLQGTSTHSWKKYSNSQAALILQWIEQGALNN